MSQFSLFKYKFFYKVNKNATGDNTQELILGYNEQYYGSDFVITDSGYWYFLNYMTFQLLCLCK